MRNQIVNIRGCNGSGKTHTVRRFLQRLPSKALGGKPGRPAGYYVDATEWGIARPVYIVGSYENTCGGADGIKTQEEIAERVVAAYSAGHVLVEGMLMSKLSSNGHVAPILKQRGAIFGFLDTPWELCLERVLARRLAADNDKPFDPDKTMRSVYNQCHRSAELLTQAGGYDVRWIDYTDPVGVVVNWLREAEQ